MPFISAAITAIGAIGTAIGGGLFAAIGKAVLGIGYAKNARKVEGPRDRR